MSKDQREISIPKGNYYAGLADGRIARLCRNGTIEEIARTGKKNDSKYCDGKLKILQITFSSCNLKYTNKKQLMLLWYRPFLVLHRQNRLRFVYTHFKSCDQSLDKTSFDF